MFKEGSMVTNAIILFVCVSCVLSYSKKGWHDPPREKYPHQFPQPITRPQVNEAIREAFIEIEARYNIENELSIRGLVTQRGTPSSYHQSLFRGDVQLLSQNRRAGLIETETARILVNRLQLSGDRIRELDSVSLNGTQAEEACPTQPTCTNLLYRSTDGSCNNLENLNWGRSFTALERLLRPNYDDGVDSPRQTGVNGGPLPNPRLVSTTLSRNVDNPSRYLTEMFTQWGQFIDHDITQTSLTRAPGEVGITCCNEEVRNNPNMRHPACLAIDIAPNDPFYGPLNQDCMEFVRSTGAPRAECTLGQRQQLNMLTAFLDGSMIYGNVLNDSNGLRSFERGRLRSSEMFGETIMPPDTTGPCSAPENGPPCILGGDARANEQSRLSVFHIIWFREHNRVAGILARLNPGWNDETLYQETRKIIGAMIQHITYNEFLPLLLGQRTMEAFSLYPQKHGASFAYDRRINPSISNVFATAAYRLGHSLVQGNVPLVSRNNMVTANLNLSSQYFNPTVVYTDDSLEMVVRGLATQPTQSLDQSLSDQLTNHLFQDRGAPFGLDLLSLNIQRGRDHGLPGYNSWRQLCQLPRVENFEQLYQVMNPEAVEVFRRLYSNVEDLDLFPAGISENTVQRDSLLPPTFGCLVAEQFRRLKIGDRFWYENGNMETSFRDCQLDEIRKVTLARVLCDNSNIQAVQKNAFLASTCRNPVDTCIQGHIPRMSLDPWKEVPNGWWY